MKVYGVFAESTDADSGRDYQELVCAFSDLGRAIEVANGKYKVEEIKLDLKFPEGEYAYSFWLDVRTDNLKIYLQTSLENKIAALEGECSYSLFTLTGHLFAKSEEHAEKEILEMKNKWKTEGKI